MSERRGGIVTTVTARAVAEVTIDRAATGNALTPDARDELTDVFSELSSSAQVRAVLLRSTGDRHFCTGAGLDPTMAAASTEPRIGDVARVLSRGWQRLIAAMLDCEKPIVTAVQGVAAGAGASLVLASDLVVMAETASLAEVFVRRGLAPDAGAVYLLDRIVGLRKASEILLLGETVDARTCERLGIVNRVVPAADVARASAEWADRLAQGPTVALAMTKKLLTAAADSDRARAFEQEAWAQEVVSWTRDKTEGIGAFVDRRTPRFEGR